MISAPQWMRRGCPVNGAVTGKTGHFLNTQGIKLNALMERSHRGDALLSVTRLFCGLSTAWGLIPAPSPQLWEHTAGACLKKVDSVS